MRRMRMTLQRQEVIRQVERSDNPMMRQYHSEVPSKARLRLIMLVCQPRYSECEGSLL